jgi:hypothetical protein
MVHSCIKIIKGGFGPKKRPSRFFLARTRHGRLETAHGLPMQDDTASVHIVKAAFDALYDRQLARNEVRYCLAREIRFCAVCLTGQTPELLFQFSRKTHSQRFAVAHSAPFWMLMYT